MTDLIEEAEHATPLRRRPEGPDPDRGHLIASFGTVRFPRTKIQIACREVELAWSERDLSPTALASIRRDLPKIYSFELAEVIFVNPYCRISDLVSAGIAKRQSASVYLKTLAEHGLLQEMKSGRENLFINPALLALLSDQPRANL